MINKSIDTMSYLQDTGLKIPMIDNIKFILWLKKKKWATTSNSDNFHFPAGEYHCR